MPAKLTLALEKLLIRAAVLVFSNIMALNTKFARLPVNKKINFWQNEICQDHAFHKGDRL